MKLDLNTITHRLTKARAQRTPLSPFTQADDHFGIEQGYQVQEMLLERALEAGEKLCGYKMGLTSKAKQADVGVNAPISGFFLKSMEHPAGKPLVKAELIHPRAEPEIACVMGKDLIAPPSSWEQMADFVFHLGLAVEILDSRYKDFKFQLPDVIADNTSAARFMLGKVNRLSHWKDLPLEGVVVKKNGRVVETGTPGAVLGNPLIALFDMAHVLHKKGQGLKKGQVILTGGCTASVPLEPKDELEFLWAAETLKLSVV